MQGGDVGCQRAHSRSSSTVWIVSLEHLQNRVVPGLYFDPMTMVLDDGDTQSFTQVNAAGIRLQVLIPNLSYPIAPPGMLGQNERRDSEMGRTWRIVIIVSAIGCCLLMAGLAFGFSALMPNLLRIGAFHQVCPENHAGTSCQAQISRLTGMFTLTSSLLNILTLPSGAMLDYLGPRVTAGSFCCFVALGCWLFSLGSDVNYYVGFILLGDGADLVRLAQAQAGKWPGDELFVSGLDGEGR